LHGLFKTTLPHGIKKKIDGNELIGKGRKISEKVTATKLSNYLMQTKRNSSS
jgi:hypothetical protein